MLQVLFGTKDQSIENIQAQIITHSLICLSLFYYLFPYEECQFMIM